MLRSMSLSLTAPPAPPHVEPPKRRRRLPWRSPADQPPWARPVLLALAAVAATVYAWRLPDNPLHGYYAPAVKSMSVSWRAFFYGGGGPAAPPPPGQPPRGVLGAGPSGPAVRVHPS